MVEHDRDIMAKVVPDVRKKTPEPIIRENVRPGSAVRTYLLLAKADYR